MERRRGEGGRWWSTGGAWVNGQRGTGRDKEDGQGTSPIADCMVTGAEEPSQPPPAHNLLLTSPHPFLNP